ncbi:MAG: hypothetical protein Q8K79_22180 [Solirubrobacteraceae bacterium]|nr:hypothetical protein [Solirubrobacteraceae bacterium]
MFKKSRGGGAKQQQAPAQPAQPTQPAQPAQPAASPARPTQEYAKLGSDAPIAWPSVGGRRVPVTGQLSPHAQAALKRMGITKE